MGDSKNTIGSEPKGCFQPLKSYVTTKKEKWGESIENNPKRARNAEITGIVLLVITGAGFLAVGVVGASSFMGATAWAPGFMGAINVTISSAGGWIPFAMTGVGGAGALELLGVMIFGVYKLIQSSKTKLNEKDSSQSVEEQEVASKQEVKFGKDDKEKTFELYSYPKAQVDKIFANEKIQEEHAGNIFLYNDSTDSDALVLTMVQITSSDASDEDTDYEIKTVTTKSEIESAVLGAGDGTVITRLPRLKKEVVDDSKFTIGSTKYEIQVYKRNEVKALLTAEVKAEMLKKDERKAFVYKVDGEDADRSNQYVIVSNFDKLEKVERKYFTAKKMKAFKDQLQKMGNTYSIITDLEGLKVLQPADSRETEDSKSEESVHYAVTLDGDIKIIIQSLPQKDVTAALEAEGVKEAMAEKGSGSDGKQVAFVYLVNDQTENKGKVAIAYKSDGSEFTTVYKTKEEAKVTLEGLKDAYELKTDIYEISNLVVASSSSEEVIKGVTLQVSGADVVIEVLKKEIVTAALTDKVKAAMKGDGVLKAFVYRVADEGENKGKFAIVTMDGDAVKVVHFDELVACKEALDVLKDTYGFITTKEGLAALVVEDDPTSESEEVAPVAIKVEGLDANLQVNSYTNQAITDKLSEKLKEDMKTTRKAAFVYQIADEGDDKDKFVIFFKEGEGEYSPQMFGDQEACKTKLNALKAAGWSFETTTAKLDEYKGLLGDD